MKKFSKSRGKVGEQGTKSSALKRNQSKQEPVEPGNAPHIGIGHREVICQKWL